MAKQTAVTEAVTAKVLRTFRDKYTKKLRGKGTEFSCDEKRVAEINFGQPKPLVVIVGAKPQAAAPTEPETPPTQAAAPTEPETKGKGKGKGAGKTDK